MTVFSATNATVLAAVENWMSMRIRFILHYPIMKVRICAVQFVITKNKEENLKKAETYFETASKNKCNIICFPEMFLQGSLELEDYDGNFVRQAKRKFSELSKNHRIYSIMGSIIEKRGKQIFNASYVFDDKGKILGRYDKIHLVRNSEREKLSRGKSAKVFKTKFGKIGIQICRDLLYPEVTRELMRKGAEIVFCPSYWCSRSSSYPRIYNEKYFGRKEPREVDFLVSARAIESECVFIYVNAAGEMKEKKKWNVLLGRTQIAVPFYGAVKRIEDNREGILIFDVDKKIISDAKKVYYIDN